MTACKEYRHQLALLSVETVDDSKHAAVLGHLKHCAECRAYWERLQTVVTLYKEDAQRSIVASPGRIVVSARPKQELFTWWRAVAATATVLALSAAIFLSREDAPQPEPPASEAAPSNPSAALSIADSRPLLNEDLETLLEIPKQHNRSEFVFSVATRYEGP